MSQAHPLGRVWAEKIGPWLEESMCVRFHANDEMPWEKHSTLPEKARTLERFHQRVEAELGDGGLVFKTVVTKSNSTWDFIVRQGEKGIGFVTISVFSNFVRVSLQPIG